MIIFPNEIIFVQKRFRKYSRGSRGRQRQLHGIKLDEFDAYIPGLPLLESIRAPRLVSVQELSVVHFLFHSRKPVPLTLSFSHSLSLSDVLSTSIQSYWASVRTASFSYHSEGLPSSVVRGFSPIRGSSCANVHRENDVQVGAAVPRVPTDSGR